MSNSTILKNLVDRFVKNTPGSNKHTDFCNTQTQNLAKSLSLRYAVNLTQLTGYVYPEHSSKSLQIANNWHFWLWTFDDFVDNPEVCLKEKKILIDKCLEIINGEVFSYEDEITELLCNVWTRIRSTWLETSNLWEIFQNNVKKYLIEGVSEKLKLELGLDDFDLSLDDYKKIRRYDGACETVFPLIYLDSPDLTDSSYSEVCKLANQVIYLTNDLISYQKDVNGDHTCWNYVFLYKHYHDVTLKESFEHTFEKICSKLEKLERKRESELVENLMIWINGSFYWHSISPRYNSL